MVLLGVLYTVLFEKEAGSTEYFSFTKKSLLEFEYFLIIKLKVTKMSRKKWQVILNLIFLNYLLFNF